MVPYRTKLRISVSRRFDFSGLRSQPGGHGFPSAGESRQEAANRPQRGMAADLITHEAWWMQVPPDLVMRITTAARSSGRSPEAFLREAVCRLIESTVQTVPSLGELPNQTGFIPQSPRFSVYE